jgi:hypothetical protein
LFDVVYPIELAADGLPSVRLQTRNHGPFPRALLYYISVNPIGIVHNLAASHLEVLRQQLGRRGERPDLAMLAFGRTRLSLLVRQTLTRWGLPAELAGIIDFRYSVVMRHFRATGSLSPASLLELVAMEDSCNRERAVKAV